MSCESNCHLQPWSNATEEEGIAVASAAFVLFSGYHLLNKIKKKKRRWWMTSFNKSRSRYNGSDMLSDLLKSRVRNLEISVESHQKITNIL
ncbi:unnamed protein product [Parnassius mnemosyne]|uniref:Transmembrane protein n=1 Tax=Parnassius mnemosyne TaxID=213953 RepID=A0AAV1L0Z9_9NEOP